MRVSFIFTVEDRIALKTDSVAKLSPLVRLATPAVFISSSFLVCMLYQFCQSDSISALDDVVDNISWLSSRLQRYQRKFVMFTYLKYFKIQISHRI